MSETTSARPTAPSSAPLAASDAHPLWLEGGQALRGGAGAGAGRAFGAILEGGRADATVWLGLAMAARLAGDAAAVLEAVDEVLAREPRNLRALMMKADHYDAAGDGLAASGFYRAVARLGRSLGALPPDLTADVERAEAAEARHTARFEAHLRSELERRGLGCDGARRVADSVDMMLGRKAIFLQQPKQYYFPELANVAFYDRAALPWMDTVDLATPAIRRELLAVLREDGAFKPYVESTPDRPFFGGDGLLGDPSWSAYYLWKNGEPVAEHLARCPETMRALADVPLCRIAGRTPSILFSLLRPGARIPAHNGLLNARLICHLPLIVPPACGFRVGSDTRAWVEGRGWAFDDSIEHEAWNDSDRLRVVLIFDVWRPELTPIERDLVSVIVSASDTFQEAEGQTAHAPQG